MSYFCQRWLETKVPRKTQPILWTTLLASLIQCITHLLPLFNWLCSTSCTDLTSSSSSVLLGLSSATFSLWIRMTNHLGLPGSEVFPHMDFSAKTNSLGHTKDDWSPTTYSLWPTSFTLLASFTPNNNIICSNHPSQKSGSHYPSLLPVWWCAKSCQFYLPSNSWLPALQISWLDYFNSKGQCLPHTPFPLSIHKAAKVKF